MNIGPKKISLRLDYIFGERETERNIIEFWSSFIIYIFQQSVIADIGFSNKNRVC